MVRKVDMSEELVKTLAMIKRLKSTQEGLDFIEYLRTLSQDNYKTWRNSSVEYNEIHKGYAKAIDSLIYLFDYCDERLAKMTKQ